MMTSSIDRWFITKIVCSSAVFLLWTSGEIIAGERKPPLLQPHYDGDCMPTAEFRLGKVAAYDSEGKVKKLLGNPKKIELIEEEDDGGRYTLRRLSYKDIVIDIVRNKVDRLYTTSPSMRTPAGIHPGLTLEETIRVLGRKPQNWDKGFGIATCPEMRDGMSWDASLIMSLSFNERGILVSIEIAANRP
jgi:hypothetical protein